MREERGCENGVVIVMCHAVLVPVKYLEDEYVRCVMLCLRLSNAQRMLTCCSVSGSPKGTKNVCVWGGGGKNVTGDML